MSKKPKVAALVECPCCQKHFHILLKISDKPKIKVVSCMFCREQMEVGYETVLNVNVEVAPMRPHMSRAPVRDGTSKLRAVSGGRPNESWPPVPRAIGATWTRSALIDGDDDV